MRFSTYESLPPSSLRRFLVCVCWKNYDKLHEKDGLRFRGRDNIHVLSQLSFNKVHSMGYSEVEVYL